MREMNKLNYESPELLIRWFESEDVIAYSYPETEDDGGVGWTPDDEW